MKVLKRENTKGVMSRERLRQKDEKKVGGTRKMSFLALDSCFKVKRAVSPTLLGKYPRATGSQEIHMQTPYLMN